MPEGQRKVLPKKSTLAALAGGLATGAAIIAFFAGGHPAASDHFQLANIPVEDISAAAATLSPSAAPALVAGAKSCTVPMANLIIYNEAGASGMIRIRSGGYLSPEFQLTNTPQRVAVPFPTPYETGAGVLMVEGNTSGAVVLLSPGWHANSVNGATAINVVWTPKKPC
jgi:hypothetical protein